MNEVCKAKNEIVSEENIYKDIKSLILNSRNNVYRAVNTEMLDLYWNIGKRLMEIQEGSKRAKYGKGIIEKISSRLTQEYGRGYSIPNLKKMRQFYLLFPICSTVLSELSWSHYLILIKINEENKRKFYMHEAVNSNWSVRELQRQVDSLLFERLAISKDKEAMLELANKGALIKSGKDLVKDPFVLEFLDIKENTEYLESDLEENLLKHLKEFLLELGKGFMLVGSKVRITLEDDHFYPDLVFYNRLLKCFVIIDLKVHKLTHQDIGQMQMYVNYYDRIIKKEDENPTIGILLGTSKNETVVEYTLPKDNENIYASIYKLGFPTKEELVNLVEQEKQISFLKD
ncbi:MAG: DUF1016 family protein [Bacilli bacterium]|nr:DUF1016 family protein [Bacilli bacterium]